MDSRKELSILIAEDSTQDFELIKIALQENGYSGNLEWFKDGEDILKYLNDPSFSLESEKYNHLALIDINMPKKNGFEVLAEIKNDPKFKLLPCILLTTSDSDEDIKKGYKLGANSYLTKPFDLDSMLGLFKAIKAYWLEKNLTPNLA